VPLSEASVPKLVRHLELIREWNRKINLTALRDLRDMAVYHVLDSLTVFKVLFFSKIRMLDIGTGGGFPGLVLRIVDNDLNITLLDRDTKKIVFLKYAAHELGLERIRFLNFRIADLIHSPVLFDVVISRAFSSDVDVLGSLHQLLSTGGYLIRMAGPAPLHADFFPEHFVEWDRWEGHLPFSDSFRRVILYKKTS